MKYKIRSPATRRSVLSLTTALLHKSTTTATVTSLFSTKPHLPNSVPCQSKNLKTSNLVHSSDFTDLRDILSNPGPDLENALQQSQVVPTPELLLQIFNHFDCSPKLLYTLFLWAEKRAGYQFSVAVFNGVINALGRARDFDRAWDLIHGNVDGCNVDTFAILIRRYARAGLPCPAINAYEFTSKLDFLNGLDLQQKLFEILLDSLCKEGLVRVASECFAKRRAQDVSWVPSVVAFNILLNGWLRSKSMKQAEELFVEMKKENIKPSVVTYGTLVEGFCRMGRVDVAMELIEEMRREELKPNAIVYNPVIDALGEAGKFDDALGMMEKLFVLESAGPTVSTYNSLVKGFCKAGDLEGANNILKVMMNRGIMPTTTTYNYFFRHLSKFGKIEEGFNLYTKILESGYAPDRLTYHLLVKMLCEQGRLDLSMQVVKEMRSRGCDMDLATSTMLIHLQVKMNHLNMAFEEFEGLIRRGLVPQYLTYEKMSFELRRQGKEDIAQKLSALMEAVPHSKKVPNTFSVRKDFSHAKKISILQRAAGMSDVLKTCKNPRKLLKRRTVSQTAVSSSKKSADEQQKR